MANTFTDLSTDSPGEARDESYWQSCRAKDGFEKVSPGDHESPDADRTRLVPVAGTGSKGVDIPPAPAPDLQPEL